MMENRKWILIGVGLGLVVIASGLIPDPPVRERVGEMNVLHDGGAGFPFKLIDQAEILLSGLDDPRGLACSDQTIYIAEGTGTILRYPAPPTPADSFADKSSARIDLRGIAASHHGLLLADFSRAEIMRLPRPPSTQDEQQIVANDLTGPSGVALADHAIFVTDARPWPGPPASENTFESSDYGRWLDKGTPRLFGALFVGEMSVPGGSYTWTAAPVRLRHPSGVAAVSAGGPVYVAESDDTEVRWPVIEPLAAKWIQRRALGAVPVEGRKPGEIPRRCSVAFTALHLRRRPERYLCIQPE